MGFDFDRVIGETKELLKCSICLDVLDDPIQVVCCHQFFCRKCMEDWLSHNSNGNIGNCPFDRSRISRRKIVDVPRIVRLLLETLAIQCQNLKNGCKQVCKLSEVESHETTCEYRSEVLIGCECGLLISRRDISHHKCIRFLSQKLEAQNKTIIKLQTQLRDFKTRLKPSTIPESANRRGRSRSSKKV